MTRLRINMTIKRYTFAFLLIVLSSNLIGQDALPPEAENLKTKLEEWESERQKELAEEIQKKRGEVVIALQSQLQSATQGGDLDGAIAIRNLIAQLSSKKEEGDSPEAGAMDKTSLESRIAGSVWTWYVEQHKLHLFAGGKASVEKEEGGALEFSWEASDDRSIILRRQGGEEFGTIEFDSRFKKAVVEQKSANGRSIEIEKVK